MKVTTRMHDEPAAIPPYVRPINFAGIELLLDLLHHIREFYGDVDLEALLILLCASDATMRAFMANASRAQSVIQVAKPPENIRGSISRRAIADKTGIARETVRRKVAELAQSGLLIVDDDDSVRISYGLVDRRAWTTVEQAHLAVLRYLDRLKEFGIDHRAVTSSFSE